VGFLSRDKTGATAVPLRPIEISDATLVEAAQRLTAFESAVGTSDAPVRAAVRALAETAGAMDIQVLMQRGLSPEEAKRPWHWLVKVASHARDQGDDVLPARILLFTTWWSSMEPGMTVGDYMDMLLDPIPSELRALLNSMGLDSLRRLPPETVIAPTNAGAPNAGQLLAAAGG